MGTGGSVLSHTLVLSSHYGPTPPLPTQAGKRFFVPLSRKPGTIAQALFLAEKM